MRKGEVTLKDVAKAVGKSVAAVSKALNDHQDIALETRQAIKQAAREMGYVPNVTAQRLQKQRTDTLGLIVPALSARQADPFFTELLAGLADRAAAQELDLLVSTRAAGREEETAYRRLVEQRRVDGVIVALPRRNDWRITFLQAQTLPFVLVGHYSPTLIGPAVLIDTATGLEQAVDHLAEQGRLRPALIPPPANLLFSGEAVRAFEQAVADRPALTGQVSAAINDFSQKEGYRAARLLFAGMNPPDAIVCCHDLVAMGAMAAIQDQGFEVGSDIAVIGFGDILLSEHAQPPLTSIHQPTYDMGRQACRMLTALIAGEPLANPQVVIEPWLVVRQSSGLELWL